VNRTGKPQRQPDGSGRRRQHRAARERRRSVASFPTSRGAKTLTVSYPGSQRFNGSTASVNVEVN
jgi:hypothetical protein